MNYRRCISAASFVTVVFSSMAGLHVSAVNKVKSSEKASSSWPEYLWACVTSAATGLMHIMNKFRDNNKDQKLGVYKGPRFFESGERMELERMLAKTPESVEKQVDFFNFYKDKKRGG